VSIFAFYFASQLLGEAGWPRKLGRFKGVGYDATMVDLVFAQSIDWAASLGAGRPHVSLQMIAEMFRDRDWDGDDGPNVKVFVEGRREDEAQWGPWQSADSPQEAVPSKVQFGTGMSALSHEQFLGLKRATEPYLFNALLWGLDNPKRFEAWYSSQAADYESKLPLMRKAGLEIDDELPSLSESFVNSEQVVRDYERDIGPLPSSIPPRLLADAEALGWRV
jgi:hypothetical protein